MADTAMLRVESRQSFVRLLHRELQLDAFFDAANRALALLVPFDSSCWLSLDPATLLPTSHFTQEIESEHFMALAANEYLDDDVNKFADLARAARPVATMNEATGGDPTRSDRYVRLLSPLGYQDGDELRAAFIEGNAVWGCVVIHRRQGVFDDREAGLVAEVGGYLAAGIRRAILRSALVVDGEPEPPGLILLRADDSIETVTPAARMLLHETFDGTGEGARVPLTVISLAHNARLAASGETDTVASIRLPRRTGGWLRLDASLLDEQDHGRVAVIVSPAREPEVAALIAEAYGLSARERELTQLVLHGRSTQEIADALHVSPYTVQDHLKSIFTKVGVRSRRELAARLFLQQCAPRLEAGATPGSEGWFAGDAAAMGAPSVTRVG